MLKRQCPDLSKNNFSCCWIEYGLRHWFKIPSCNSLLSHQHLSAILPSETELETNATSVTSKRKTAHKKKTSQQATWSRTLLFGIVCRFPGLQLFQKPQDNYRYTDKQLGTFPPSSFLDLFFLQESTQKELQSLQPPWNTLWQIQQNRQQNFTSCYCTSKVFQIN